MPDTARRLRTPLDIDPECAALCQALDRLPGVRTIESCCGHGEEPFRIFLVVRSLKPLAAIAWALDRCHSAEDGWRLIARTDCAMEPVSFLIEGPPGASAAAAKIAVLIGGMTTRPA